jgi:hypothetical protein
VRNASTVRSLMGVSGLLYLIEELVLPFGNKIVGHVSRSQIRKQVTLAAGAREPFHGGQSPADRYGVGSVPKPRRIIVFSNP